MKLKPLSDRVVIAQTEAETKTDGGILLPDSAKEKPQQGKDVAVGPGTRLDDGSWNKLSVKKGDNVYYGKYAGTEVEIGLKKYVIVKESDILAIVE